MGLAGLATGLAQTPLLAVGLEILQIKYIITKGSSPDPDPEPWDPDLTLARCLKGRGEKAQPRHGGEWGWRDELN